MASWFSRHEALDQVAPPSGWWVRLKTGLGLEVRCNRRNVTPVVDRA